MYVYNVDDCTYIFKLKMCPIYFASMHYIMHCYSDGEGLG
jgi:hypothetical protein